MTEKDLRELYQKLKIVEKPLSANYTPDEYAKALMNSLKPGEEISYSVNTTLIAAN